MLWFDIVKMASQVVDSPTQILHNNLTSIQQETSINNHESPLSKKNVKIISQAEIIIENDTVPTHLRNLGRRNAISVDDNDDPISVSLPSYSVATPPPSNPFSQHFEKVNYKKARKETFEMYNLIRKTNVSKDKTNVSEKYETYPYCYEGDIYDGLGAIPSLYMRWLQFTGLYLLVLVLIHIPHLYFYNTTNQNSGVETLFSLSFSNINLSTTDKPVAIACLCIMEIVSVIVTFVYVRVMFWYIDNKNHKLDTSSKAVTLGNFAIHVSKLPNYEGSKYGETRLLEFFSQFGKVHSVTIVQNTGDLQKLKKQEEKYESKYMRVGARLEEKGGCIELISKFYYYIKLARTHDQIDELLGRAQVICTGDAFVVFQSENARNECIRLFSQNGFVKSIWKMITSTIFKVQQRKVPLYGEEQIALKVTKAKEPEDIIWVSFTTTEQLTFGKENYEYSAISKILRRSVSYLIIALFVGYSIGLAFIQKEFFSNYEESSFFYWLKHINFSKWKVFATLGVSVLQFFGARVVCSLLKYLAPFEKYRSMLSMQKSIMYKRGAAAAIMYACYLLFMLEAPSVGSNYKYFEGTSDPPVERITIPKGAIGDLPVLTESYTYYSGVFFVMITGILGNVISRFFFSFYFLVKREYMKRRAIVQLYVSNLYYYLMLPK